MLQNNLTNKMEKTEFSVSEISNRIKSLLETNFNNIRIKGEISGLKIATSGHGYFSLKDSGAVLAAICWRHALSKLNFKLSEGLEVVVTGKITAYAGQSKYQISVESIEPHGDGAFMQILTQRRKLFQAEGLFAKETKQPIPFLPKKIGIITSPTGAVIKDIIHRIADRFPSNLIIWPVSVQGETSAAEVTSAIEGFNDYQNKPDLIIIARGGGSIEDLWSFNEENVVRAAYASKIPIISAIGHETDYTLLDLVADLRAPTPTAAAEFTVPVLRDIKYTVKSLYDRSYQRITDKIDHISQKLTVSQNGLLKIEYKLDFNIQKIDELSFRLNSCTNYIVEKNQNKLTQYSSQRLKPIRNLKYKYLEYKNKADALLIKKKDVLNQHTHKLDVSCAILESLDYNKTLNRGYAIIKNQDQKIISSTGNVKSNEVLFVKMKDKEIKVTAT